MFLPGTRCAHCMSLAALNPACVRDILPVLAEACTSARSCLDVLRLACLDGSHLEPYVSVRVFVCEISWFAPVGTHQVLITLQHRAGLRFFAALLGCFQCGGWIAVRLGFRLITLRGESP